MGLQLRMRPLNVPLMSTKALPEVAEAAEVVEAVGRSARLVEFATATGTLVGHARAFIARVPDLLDASRGVAKLGLPRRARGPVVGFFDRAIEAVAAAQLSAEETAKKERE